MKGVVALLVLGLAIGSSAAAVKGKPPLIISTDVDIDDMLAVSYLLHSDVYDIRAIIVNGNAFSFPIGGVPNMLTNIKLAGCPNNIPVAYGAKESLIKWGSGADGLGTFLPWVIPPIDDYFTASCMNLTQSEISTVPPSPYLGAELIVKAVRGSEQKVDVVVLGSFTDLAMALDRDPSIHKKIGTVYISGGDYNYTGATFNKTWPYDTKNKGTGWNVFVDPLAMHMVLRSGIKNFVAMPSTVQNTLPMNMATSDRVINALNLASKLTSRVYEMASKMAPYTGLGCLNQAYTDLSWWDESAVAMMVKHKLGQPSFCKSWRTVKTSVFMYDGGRFGRVYNDEEYGVNVTVCTVANETEFLTDYWTTLATPLSCPKGHKSTAPSYLSQGRKMIQDALQGVRTFFRQQ